MSKRWRSRSPEGGNTKARASRSFRTSLRLRASGCQVRTTRLMASVAAKAAAEDPAFREALGKLSLGFLYADADAFRNAVQQDHAFFKQLIPKIGLRA